MNFHLSAAINELKKRFNPCRLCPRACEVNREQDQRGHCRAGRRPEIAAYHQHLGEEPFLVGQGGSGTIFFSRCNLECVFCQNYEISHHGAGRPVEIADLSRMMLDLQDRGCHNINLVSPTIWAEPIAETLVLARQRGLTIPIVYNTGGYEAVETIRLLEGMIDIYLPDVKYADNATGRRWSGVPDYWDIVRPALKEMHRQVGDLQVQSGIARRGLLVRHLVMPDGAEASRVIFEFLARELSPQTVVNVMAQYHPAGDAGRFPVLNRPLRPVEYRRALENLARAGLPLHPALYPGAR